MSDESRWKRRYERIQFERSIAKDIRTEREQREDRALLVRQHATTNPLCRRLV